MLRIFRHIRKFLLSALKRYSPGRLLQYLLALCRAVFSRSKSKCSGQDSSHESLAEEGIAVGHVISGSRTPAQVEAGLAHIEEIPLLCVCDHLLPIVYANHHHLLVQGMTNLNLLSDTMCALKVNFP